MLSVNFCVSVRSLCMGKLLYVQLDCRIVDFLKPKKKIRHWWCALFKGHQHFNDFYQTNMPSYPSPQLIINKYWPRSFFASL